MPVIKGAASIHGMTAQKRTTFINQITEELSGKLTENGPVIFEIPLGPPDQIDVLIVWDAWEQVSAQDRADIVLAAYKKRKEQRRIAQALGVTYSEAIQQGVLPYSVQPMARANEADPEKLKSAMLSEGGFRLPGGKVELRFPTMDLAMEAHRRLYERLPRGYWGVVQTVATIED
jgi:hypothetical protein